MDDRYPALLEDREILVVQGDEREQARLRCWLDGWDGPTPTYRIELAARLGQYGGPYTATGPDIFEALVRLRRQLEPEGIMVAVQGSQRDTYPSGMLRDMGGGGGVYVMHPGQKASRHDTVGTLEDAPVDQLATVDEQKAFWKAWRAEPDKA